MKIKNVFIVQYLTCSFTFYIHRLCNFVPTTESTTLLPEDLQMLEGEGKPMTFTDLIPNPRAYDKMRPPKIGDNPTKVGFHVTVMGLDSINEYSMVSIQIVFDLTIEQCK